MIHSSYLAGHVRYKSGSGEMVDTLVLGTSTFGVWVRVPPPAPIRLLITALVEVLTGELYAMKVARTVRRKLAVA